MIFIDVIFRFRNVYEARQRRSHQPPLMSPMVTVMVMASRRKSNRTWKILENDTLMTKSRTQKNWNISGKISSVTISTWLLLPHPPPPPPTPHPPERYREYSAHGFIQWETTSSLIGWIRTPNDLWCIHVFVLGWILHFLKLILPRGFFCAEANDEILFRVAGTIPWQQILFPTSTDHWDQWPQCHL